MSHLKFAVELYSTISLIFNNIYSVTDYVRGQKYLRFPELFNTLIEQLTAKMEVTFMCFLEITQFSTVRHSSILCVSEYLCTTYPIYF